MILLQTEKQKEAAKLPNKLEFADAMFRRGLYVTSKELRGYDIGRIGEMGEQILLDYIEKHGEKHWKVLRNVWLNENGNFECDLILITSHKLYIFEVKYYNGTFIYDVSGCRIKNMNIDTNCIEQTRRAYTKIERILQRYPDKINVEMVNVFTSPDNKVIIDIEVTHSTIVPRHDLMEFIIDISNEECNYLGWPIDAEKLVKHFEKYELSRDPFLPKALSDEQLAKAQRGIYCEKCGEYGVTTSKHKVMCECGYIEDKEHATLRIICEYGVLTYDRELRIEGINRLIGGQVSDTFIRKLMKKHFQAYPNGRYTTYENPKLPYK